MIMNIPDNSADIGKIKDTLGYTASKKNLLEHTMTSMTSSSGLTITVNEDKSITINGTATANGFFSMCSADSVSLPYGEYILSGCPQGGSDSTYYAYVQMNSSNGDKFYDYGEGVNFTIDDENALWVVRIYTVSGQKYDNLTFYPMIRKADITDDTYEPYAESVDSRLEELNSDLSSIIAELEEIKEHHKWKDAGYIQGNIGTLTLNCNLSELVELKVTVGEYGYNGNDERETFEYDNIDIPSGDVTLNKYALNFNGNTIKLKNINGQTSTDYTVVKFGYFGVKYR